MSVLRLTVPPVRLGAACRLLCTDSEVLGTPFFMYDYVEGHLYKDARLPNVSPSDRKDIYHSMVSTLALCVLLRACWLMGVVLPDV